MTSRLSVWAASMAIAAASGLIIPAATNTTAGAQPWCTSDALYLTTAAPVEPIATDQTDMVVFVNNVSEQSCFVPAYPDVDLVGPDDPVFGPSYRIPQQPGDPQPVMIEPAEFVSSLLTFLPGPTDGWVPDTIVMTFPGISGPVEGPWLLGVSVLRQDAATHPGTYIGGLQNSG